MPEAEAEGADQAEDAIAVFPMNPPLTVAEERPKAHTNGDGMTVQKPRFNLKPWRPGVAIGMGAALVGFVKVVVLGLHIAAHGGSEDLFGRARQCHPQVDNPAYQSGSLISSGPAASR